MSTTLNVNMLGHMHRQHARTCASSVCHGTVQCQQARALFGVNRLGNVRCQQVRAMFGVDV